MYGDDFNKYFHEFCKNICKLEYQEIYDVYDIEPIDYMRDCYYDFVTYQPTRFIDNPKFSGLGDVDPVF